MLGGDLNWIRVINGCCWHHAPRSDEMVACLGPRTKASKDRQRPDLRLNPGWALLAWVE